MAADYKYFAFISYSHADQRWSRWLHRALETYRVPARLIGQATGQGPVPGRLAPVFRDRDELTGGADLSSKVTAALEASRNLVVICSPAAARSRWVDEEVRTFKRMGRGDRIFTLIVDGEPNVASRPGEEHRECFAPSLRFQLEPDGTLSTRRAEPIAADARPGKDGKTGARIRLIAGLLDVGLDDLRQREYRRQRKRLLLITTASVAGTLMTGILAITAWLARQDAVRNRDRAEDLISFMLGDFRQELEPLGKLELLKNVGDKAMAYFSSLNERDITDQSLLRRAEALRQIGDVRLSLGEFGPALDAFHDSLTLSRTLSKRSPDNQDWLFALGNAWFWVGNTYWQKGDLEAAVAPMTEYLKAAERLVQLDPGNRKWQLERGYALGSVGALAFARGDSADAIQKYEAATDVTERLLADAPADVELLRSRIEYHSWLASIRESRGELQSARGLHAETLELTRDLLVIQPDDRRLWEEEVLRRKLYGNVLLLTGQLDEADRVMRDALTRMRTLVGLDPANAMWQRQLASVLEHQSRVLRASGRCDEALPMIDEGLETSARIADKAAEMSVAELTRLALRNDKASCLLATGQTQEAMRMLDASLAETAAPNQTRVDFVAYASALAMTRYLAGDARAATGEPDGARQQWQTGLALLEPRHSDPNYLAARVLLLYALARSKEAREIHAQLSAQGYAEPYFVLRTKAASPPH